MSDEIYFTEISDPDKFPDPISCIFEGPGIFHYRVLDGKILITSLTEEPIDADFPWFRMMTPGHYYLQGKADWDVVIHKMMTAEELEEKKGRSRMTTKGDE